MRAKLSTPCAASSPPPTSTGSLTLRRRAPVDEVNFWKPGSDAKSFRVLDSGEPFFFKLKSPHNAIAGFGYFAHFSQLPASIAWEVYGQANGAPSYPAMRQRLAHYRSRFDMDIGAKTDFSIDCILINEPTFFPDDDWVCPGRLVREHRAGEGLRARDNALGWNV